jgi:hypothetical protein
VVIYGNFARTYVAWLPAQQKELLFDFNHFAALVLAAMRTRTMSPDFFMAIRAFGELRDLQRVVSAPDGGAAFGVSAFRIWHNSIISLIPAI